jgi:hypothetical protein
MALPTACTIQEVNRIFNESDRKIDFLDIPSILAMLMRKICRQLKETIDVIHKDGIGARCKRVQSCHYSLQLERTGHIFHAYSPQNHRRPVIQRTTYILIIVFRLDIYTQSTGEPLLDPISSAYEQHSLGLITLRKQVR